MFFRKYEGLGNDYVYVDVVGQPGLAECDLGALAQVVSDRHFGVGSDGLILLCPPTAGTKAHVRMRMFNVDGSESEMCGNGVRCVAKFAHDHMRIREDPMLVETGRGVLSIRYIVDRDSGELTAATVDMGEPILAAAAVPTLLAPTRDGMVIDGQLPEFAGSGELAELMRQGGVASGVTCVSMGNPHAVLFCEKPELVPLERLGRLIEHHPAFPRRTNVHVVMVPSRTCVVARTWERGSGITLASGTGASAILVASVLTGRADRAATLELPGGELMIHWEARTNHVMMTGPATETFSGTLSTGLLRKAGWKC